MILKGKRRMNMWQVYTEVIKPTPLRRDYPTVWLIFTDCISRWSPEMVAEKMIKAGMAKAQARNVKTGEPMYIWVPKDVVLDDIVKLCLAEKDLKRIEKQGTMYWEESWDK